MSLQVTETEFCKAQIAYQAEPEKVKAKRQETLIKFRKVKVPGFRKGKAPDYVLESSLKKQIDDEIKRELLTEAYDDIIFETNFRPIGMPQITRAELHDNSFFCEMTLLRKPTIELQQYKGFEIPLPHQPHSAPEMVERMLQEMRVNHGDVMPYGENDFVQMGDKVTLDCLSSPTEVFSGDLLPLPPLDQEGILYHVGDGMFPGFDDNILGMSPGEERGFTVTTPEKVIVNCKVKLHMGMRTLPAHLDDSLAQKAGFESYDKMRQIAEGIASGRIQENQRHLVSQQIIKRLLSLHQFEVPTWLASMEAQQMVMQAKLKWTELNDQDKDLYLQRAKENVKLALIMDEIKEKEPEMAFSDSELINVVRQRVSSAGQDSEKFLVESQKDGRLVGLLASLRNEATLEWLISQSTIVE